MCDVDDDYYSGPTQLFLQISHGPESQCETIELDSWVSLRQGEVWGECQSICDSIHKNRGDPLFFFNHSRFKTEILCYLKKKIQQFIDFIRLWNKEKIVILLLNYRKIVVYYKNILLLFLFNFFLCFRFTWIDIYELTCIMYCCDIIHIQCTFPFE